MRLVSAVVRTSRLKDVEDALVAAGVPDITVRKVAGFTGRPALDRKELTKHMQVDIVLQADQTEPVIDCICEAAWSGMPGDGILYVTTLDRVLKIKDTRNP